MKKKATKRSFPSANESFQRLEDFSTYTSCIRCFGRSIISPLLNAEQREEACRFRTAAAKIEADNVKKKEECSIIKVTSVSRSLEEHSSICSSNEFALHSEYEEQNSALHTADEHHFQTCLANDPTIFSNEMHISTCKILSSDICSTVHKNVIVSPNIFQTNNDKEESPLSDTKRPTSCFDLDEAHPVLDNVECSSFQDSNQQDLTAWVSAMPYESAPTEQMYSVSEDEHDSVTESTEFGSLPTVIEAKQFVPQDTDSESNATCLTQSTDLEKYMDSSIEYSSPDDLALSRSQMSNNLNASTRSDDASSETLVNTGSESTPCSSAMAVLGYADDARFDIVPKKNLSGSLVDSSVVPKRAHSVDSYIKMVEACAEKSQIKKSLSDPSYTESKYYSEVSLSSTESNPPDVTLENRVPKTETETDDSQRESAFVSDSEVCMSFESMREAKKSLKRKHVRTNSYTLEHPSPALILAHADCKCSEDSPNLSPHSCSSDKIVHSPPNVAFKKEKVNIVLPPTSERDRYFPILNSTSVSTKKPDVYLLEDNTELSMSGVIDETEVQLPEAAFTNSQQEENVSKSFENSNIDTKQAENVSRESCEESSDVSAQNVDQQKQQIAVSSVTPGEAKSNIKELLNQVIHDMKELQKNRVNQFFEEQNKLWLQMQEEFKEQEILLCEKLKAVDILPSPDGAHPMPYELSDVDIQQHSLVEQNIPNTNVVPLSSINSNTRNDCLFVENTKKELSEVDASEKSHSPKSLSDTTNFEVTESSSSENILSSQSTIPTTDTREELEIPPMLPNRSSSLSASNGSLQADSFDGYHTGSLSIQSNVSSKSFNNSYSPLQNSILGVLRDRSEGPHLIITEASINGNLKTSESHNLHYNMSPKSFSNSNRGFQNRTLDMPSDRPEGQPSSTSETSLHNNLKASESQNLQSSVSSKIFSNTDRLEGNFSSMSETSIGGNFKTSESHNLQYNMSPKSFSNSVRQFQNLTPISVSSDRLEGLYSSTSETSLRKNLKVSESHNLQSSMSSKSCSNSDRLEGHFSSMSETSIDGNLKASEVSVGSNIQRGIPMQSLYDSCPISVMSVPYCLESNSSVSCRSSSDLSHASDVFHDPRFLKENCCPACSLGLSNVGVCQEHRENGSVCPECSSCLKCYSFDRRHISYGTIGGSGNTHFTTPISPAEFIPHPSLLMKEKNSTMNSLAFQNHGVTAFTFKNNNFGPLDLNSSDEISNSDQYPLLNNNLESNMKQNMLIINTKNDLSDMNTPDDKSYSEDEIRAINHMVQSSYTSSYSCTLNGDYLITSNNSNKNPSHAQGCKSAHHIPAVEKRALKQSSSTSLTNLKRRHSRDIVKDPILLKKFEKLPALVKGYLTRRLLKTERVQDLIRTLKDTALLVGNFSQELKSKGNAVSQNDVDFHRQLITQLFNTFISVYDIFCTISIKEQMKIISESRNFRMKKKTIEKNESSASEITQKFRSSPSKKPKVSAATLKALERKRSSINSRTYTVEDFKSRKPKVHSTTTTKSCATSPSRIYKSSIGTSMKRKTTSVCKISPWK